MMSEPDACVYPYPNHPLLEHPFNLAFHAAIMESPQFWSLTISTWHQKSLIKMGWAHFSYSSSTLTIESFLGDLMMTSAYECVLFSNQGGIRGKSSMYSTDGEFFLNPQFGIVCRAKIFWIVLIGTFLGHFETFLGHFETWWDIVRHLETFWDILRHIGTFYHDQHHPLRLKTPTASMLCDPGRVLYYDDKVSLFWDLDTSSYEHLLWRRSRTISRIYLTQGKCSWQVTHHDASLLQLIFCSSTLYSLFTTYYSTCTNLHQPKRHCDRLITASEQIGTTPETWFSEHGCSLNQVLIKSKIWNSELGFIH